MKKKTKSGRKSQTRTLFINEVYGRIYFSKFFAIEQNLLRKKVSFRRQNSGWYLVIQDENFSDKEYLKVTEYREAFSTVDKQAALKIVDYFKSEEGRDVQKFLIVKTDIKNRFKLIPLETKKKIRLTYTGPLTRKRAMELVMDYVKYDFPGRIKTNMIIKSERMLRLSNTLTNGI